MSLIDRYLPTFDVRDYHETRVNAPADAAYAALRSLDLNRSRIVRALFAVRGLPGRLGGSTPPPPPPGPFLQQALAIGWVVLDEVPGRELAVGAVTQPWASVVIFRGLPANEFMKFSTPGFTKIVWALGARPLSATSTVLSMETRVLATDPVSRRKFRWYWLVVNPGVRLIRVVALHLAKRELRRPRRR